MDSGWDIPALPGMRCRIRTSPAQRLLTAPRGFSQPATSFFGSWRLGIPRTPLLAPRSVPHGRATRRFARSVCVSALVKVPLNAQPELALRAARSQPPYHRPAEEMPSSAASPTTRRRAAVPRSLRTISSAGSQPSARFRRAFVVGCSRYKGNASRRRVPWIASDTMRWVRHASRATKNRPRTPRAGGQVGCCWLSLLRCRH